MTHKQITALSDCLTLTVHGLLHADKLGPKERVEILESLHRMKVEMGVTQVLTCYPHGQQADQSPPDK